MTKISNVDTISKLVGIQESIDLALVQAKEYKTYISLSVDEHAPVGFNIGHNTFIQKYSSGDSTSIDLSGCYVGVQMADAAIGVLTAQYEAVTNELIVYGVEKAKTPVIEIGSDIFKQLNQEVFVKIPVGGSGSEINYSSSNDLVASVSSSRGVVWMHNAGSSLITAIDTGSLSTDSYTLTVYDNVEFSTFPVIVVADGSVNVVVNNGSGEFAYSVDNNSVASIDDTGLLIPNTSGIVGITVTDTKTGASITANVELYDTVTIGPNIAKLLTDGDFEYRALTGSGDYTYTSGDDTIATVSTDGAVSMIMSGTVDIIVTDDITGLSAVYVLTIS